MGFTGEVNNGQVKDDAPVILNSHKVDGKVAKHLTGENDQTGEEKWLCNCKV